MELKNQPIKQRLIHGSLWNLIYLVISRIGALIFSILAARILLPEGYGLYNLVISVVLVFFSLSDLGINQGMTILVSKYFSNKKRAASYFQFFIKIKFLLLLGVSLILFVFAYLISPLIFKQPGFNFLLLAGAIYALTLSLDTFFASLFFISGKLIFQNIKEFIFQALRISLFLLFILLLPESKVLATLLALVVASFISLAFSYLSNLKSSSFLFIKSSEKIDKAKILKFLIFLTLGSLTTILFSYADTFIMGIFLRDEFIGLYRAAGNLMIGLIAFINMSPVILPVLMKIKQKDLASSFNRLAKYFFVLSIPLTVGMIFFSKQAINIVYGTAYKDSTLLLAILSLTSLPFIFIALYGTLLSRFQDSKSLAKSAVFFSILNISIVLISVISLRSSPYHATIGVAIASALAYFSQLIFLIVLCKRKYKISLKINKALSPFIASLVMLAYLFLINYFFNFSWLVLLATIVSAALLYFIVLFLFRYFDSYDTNLIKKIIPFKIIQ